MPSFDIVKSVPVLKTPRVLQANGLFDVPPSERTEQHWTGNLPLDERPWNIGLIVGPSGSGKTTIAREVFKTALIDKFRWSNDKSVLDDFPKGLSIKEITELLSSVGFSSPPSWLKPYRVLSTGEQFRVFVARILAEQRELAVVDEFTSVIDRTVAQIGSCAVAKAVRRRNQKLVAVSCHYDIVDWLCPDWIYQPHANEFAWGSQRRRPPIELQIKRVHRSAWELFHQYHYLDTALNDAAQCFCAFWNGIPVAFSAWLVLPHIKKHARREHRTVTLPDYQGVGIGNQLSNLIASAWRALGWDAISTTSNPAMIQARLRSEKWKLTRAPQRTSIGGAKSRAAKHAWFRNVASFEYVGATMDNLSAVKLTGAWFTPRRMDQNG